MLSIDGTTLGEVFANLATDPRLDEPERSAAGRLAAWHRRDEDLARRLAVAAQAPDRAAWDEADEEHEAHRRAKPFRSRKPATDEARTLECDGVRFVVWPYTTGATMNVGVERAK